MRTIRFWMPAIVIALAIAQAPVMAQEDLSNGRPRLEGVWEVKITPRNCTTGEPIPTAAFETLFTFHRDGTMLVSFRNNTLALERTAAHGLWQFEHGWEDFTFKFVHLRRNVSTGAFAGKQEGGGTLKLDWSGSEFTTDGWSQVFDINGIPAGTPGCSNSVGTRFKID